MSALGIFMAFSGEHKNKNEIIPHEALPGQEIVDETAPTNEMTPQQMMNMYADMSPEDKANTKVQALAAVANYLQALKEEAQHNQHLMNDITRFEQIITAINNNEPVSKTSLNTAINTLNNSAASTLNSCEALINYAKLLSFTL
jgi:hypothetical protein